MNPRFQLKFGLIPKRCGSNIAGIEILSAEVAGPIGRQRGGTRVLPQAKHGAHRSVKALVEHFQFEPVS
jgi:hypothetical protein